MTIKTQAYLVLLILTTINFLNYIDRQIIYAVFPLIKQDMLLSDKQLGLIGSAFVIVYLITSPIFGRLGDLVSRKGIIALGVGLWSLATVGASIAQNYSQLLLARSLVGIGEASYVVTAPTLISDYFGRERRGKALSFFVMALPVGSALGYILGGHLGEIYSWRSAFLIVGFPGVLMVLLCLKIREPQRGAVDDTIIYEPSADSAQISSLKEVYIALLRNKQFVTAVLGLTAYGFALGGLGAWAPTFLHRINGLPLGLANKLFGIVLIASALFGTLAGGYIGDYFLKYTKKAYFLTSSTGMLIGVPILITAILSRNPSVYWPAVFFTAFFLSFTVVLNAAIINAVHPRIRSTAMSVNIFIVHLFGDAISPPMIGWISDISDLKTAIMLTPIMIAVGALILLLGAMKTSFQERVF
ncbi:MAG: spinster family MFS transporter [Thermodesulfobacteriota bacterium]